MNLHATLYAIDCIAIFSMLLVSTNLLVAFPRNNAARLVAFFSVCSAAFVVFSRTMFASWIPEPFQFLTPEPLIVAFQILMNTVPAAFMILSFLLFKEQHDRFPRLVALLLAIQISLEDLLPYFLGITTHPSRGTVMTDDNSVLHLLFEVTPATLQALFIAVALYWTLKDWRDDLIDPRRVMRALLVVVIAVNLVTYTLLTRLVLDPGNVLMFYVHEGYQAFNALMNTAALVYLQVMTRTARSAAGVANAAGSTPDTAEVTVTADSDFTAFEAAMRAGIYRQAGLSIAALAAHIRIPEYRLRRLINTRLGYRNFSQMLNEYRIAEAAQALADPAQRRLPILTIALSVGYQSINPFNRAFRELKDTTPSAYRQSRLGSTGAVDEDDAGIHS